MNDNSETWAYKILFNMSTKFYHSVIHHAYAWRNEQRSAHPLRN